MYRLGLEGILARVAVRWCYLWLDPAVVGRVARDAALSLPHPLHELGQLGQFRADIGIEALFQLASALYEKGDYFKARAFMQRFESVGQPRPESLMLGRNIELRLGNGGATE